MKILKNKAILIFVIVFVVLLMLVVAISNKDEELEELESKFPLEDYLFQNGQQRTENSQQNYEESQYEQNASNLSEIIEKIDKNKETIESNIRKALYHNIKDGNGKAIELDEYGNPILYDKDGNRIYLDENGRPYKLDENGNRVYQSNRDKIFTSDGTEIKKDTDGTPIFKNEYGNKTKIKGNSLEIEESDGIKTIIDKDGNYITTDRAGNVVDMGIVDLLTGTVQSKLAENQQAIEQEDEDTYEYAEKPAQSKSNKSKKTRKEPMLYDEFGNIIGDSVAVENQKFEYNKATPKQRDINALLAMRLEDDEIPSPKKPKIEYGVDEFENFSDKDEGSNEHRLLRTITADRMIPAFLVRPISSQLSGTIVAQTETNIYGAMGRAVLIPKGSRVMGFYEANNKIGEYRLNIVWTRIITPHGINILLTDARGADVKGYNGLVGEVHSRNFQRYGIPLTLSTLSNGLLLAVNSMNNSQNTQDGNAQIANAYMQAQILSGMRTDVSQIIQRIIQEQIKIQPIITIREGSRIFIALSEDIFIPKPKNKETLARFFRQEIDEEYQKEEQDESSDD